ncbi:MAG: hypothetical protein RIE73_33365 [Coleofasciculus sp. C1-SOL-03]
MNRVKPSSPFTARQPGEPTAICPTSPIRSSPQRTIGVGERQYPSVST